MEQQGQILWLQNSTKDAVSAANTVNNTTGPLELINMQVFETKIAWKQAYQSKKAGQMMRLERLDSLWGHKCRLTHWVCSLFALDGQTLGLQRAWRVLGGGNYWLRELGRPRAWSSKPLLFALRSCMMWWLQLLGTAAEVFCAGNAWKPLEWR